MKLSKLTRRACLGFHVGASGISTSYVLANGGVLSYFQKSLHTKPLCPYGKDCFYQHINADGTRYIFEEGVDAAMRVCDIVSSSPS